MTALDKVTQLVQDLSEEEKQVLLALLAQQLGGTPEEAISRTPGVVGGRARIHNTRIPVWSIVEAKKMGLSDERIMSMFPSVSLNDIENALHYYAHHRSEIESDIADQEEE